MNSEPMMLEERMPSLEPLCVLEALRTIVAQNAKRPGAGASGRDSLG